MIPRQVGCEEGLRCRSFPLLLLAALAGCAYGDAFRGTDHGVVMPVIRARWSLRPPRENTTPNLVSFSPMLESAVTHVEGDLAQQPRLEYHATTWYAGFAPEFYWHGLCAGPIVGLGYGEVEVETDLANGGEEGIGLMFGADARWRDWTPFEPYVRYVESEGGDWRTGRFELGAQLRATANVALQLASARQTSRLDELGAFAPGDSARIETEGLHLGLSLRF